eukprot:gb/GFBE01003965.1/.p1 GENE.gb/GFBE01003965.1/~~gb/GFBE01003965.1/.p1  ORF type:complete len:318 (+),score=97.88 gb/GFBE01003965.1/:1-954(+)
MSASLHGDVASAIGQQVEQMILQAKKDSEARVRHELGVARQQLKQMEGHITELSDRVARCVRSNGAGAADPSQTVDRAFLSQKIKQLEQKWGSEVKALKQDLHRTILAHNHNSDLMRHHRDALEEARRRLDLQPQPKAEQVDAQIEKVDRMLRQGQAKQRALDHLTERLAALEQQVGGPMPGASAFSGMMPPGMTSMAGMGMGASSPAAATKKFAKKDGEPPSEEEVRARLLQAARGGAQGDSATSFNAEAPVFVPRGAAAEAGTKPDAGAPVTLPIGDDMGLEASLPPGLTPISITPSGAKEAKDGEGEAKEAKEA